ncbi:hypothetical protein ACFWA9_03540 [Kitasatospora sp. NPDC059973]|uniref:hypothetical protein n=1 Tax=Kitasatospora sp. NPDC059973 TaxID=3347020 RepID=UPI0036B68D27
MPGYRPPVPPRPAPLPDDEVPALRPLIALLAAAPRERIHRHDDGPHHLVPLFLLGSVGRLTVRVVAAGLEAAFSRDEPAPTTAHGGAPRSRRDPGPDRP